MFLIFSEWENLIEVSALQQKYYGKTENKIVYYYSFWMLPPEPRLACTCTISAGAYMLSGKVEEWK